MTGSQLKYGRNPNGQMTSYLSGSFFGGENISQTPVTVCGVTATNLGTVVAYVFLIDSTAAPSGASTLTPIAVPPKTTVTVSYVDALFQGGFGVTTTKGLTWGASSSASSYVADSTDVSVDVRYLA